MESVEPQKRTHSRLLVLFLVLSLFIHANFIALVVALGIMAPPPPPKPATSGVTLNLIPLPNPSKHLLETTPPDPSAPYNPKAEIESDNNSRLATKRAVERSQNQTPDIDGKAPTQDLLNSAYVPPKNQPVAPPAPEHQQVEKQALTAKSNPTQPNPQENPQPKYPIAQAPKPAPPHPAQRAQPVQQVDPNGLPVLPLIAGATVLPPDPQVNQIQAVRGGAPPPTQAEQSGDMEGISAVSDHNSVNARQSDLGIYMAKVKRAIGSIWYPKVQNQMQLVSVGVVHLRVTIHSDGSVDVIPVETEDESDRAIILQSLSMRSIKEAAPFDPFPESLRKEYGDSYSDDFTFQVYQY